LKHASQQRILRWQSPRCSIWVLGDRGLEVVHDQQRWAEVVLPQGFGIPQNLANVFAERVVVDAEMDGGAAGAPRYAEVGKASFGAREKEKLSHAEGPRHGSVVFQAVGFAFAETAGSVRFHHGADVAYEG